ncbi:hypothetical protein T05_789 [Trichinella murrelli]|uniref:Uncharacterized protein n=1 Tax=Trichinella murrelli TaxID=144512 RepID=A0A0V0THC7_9BILA|nr:hypothetical protein T05_789 [Trichinella murrelli]
MQELEYKLQSYASISCTDNVEPYQKERVFVWLPSHVMISHVHSCRSVATAELPCNVSAHLQLEPSLAVDNEWLLPNDGIRPSFLH